MFVSRSKKSYKSANLLWFVETEFTAIAQVGNFFLFLFIGRRRVRRWRFFLLDFFRCLENDERRRLACDECNDDVHAVNWSFSSSEISFLNFHIEAWNWNSRVERETLKESLMERLKVQFVQFKTPTVRGVASSSNNPSCAIWSRAAIIIYEIILRKRNKTTTQQLEIMFLSRKGTHIYHRQRARLARAHLGIVYALFYDDDCCALFWDDRIENWGV